MTSGSDNLITASTLAGYLDLIDRNIAAARAHGMRPVEVNLGWFTWLVLQGETWGGHDAPLLRSREGVHIHCYPGRQHGLSILFAWDALNGDEDI